MPDKPEDSHRILMKAKNMAGSPMFAQKPVERKINIYPDKSVSPGKFKTSPLGVYLAHPTTIKAMRKELFAAGNDPFIDLEDNVVCHSCRKELDRQFWIFCPFCEAAFEK